MPLVMITVCRDNVEDLRATLLSVSLQGLRPSRHLVIDGSADDAAPQVAREAEVIGAEYFWREPRGIYDAMRSGLALVEKDAWVWFLNATDVLAGRHVLQGVSDALNSRNIHPDHMWAVGRTAVELPTPHLLPFPAQSSKWALALRNGEIGLPHPSTIVRLSALKEVNAFDGPYRISRDYEMGLRLVRKFGPPALIHSPLSVYDQSGESAKRANENVFHKAEARLKNQSWWESVREPARVMKAAQREVLRRRYTRKGDPHVWARLGWDEAVIPPDEHFCGDTGGTWPTCCVRYLRAPETT